MKIVINIFNKSRQIKDLKKELDIEKQMLELRESEQKNTYELYKNSNKYATDYYNENTKLLKQLIEKEDNEERYEVLKNRQQTTIDQLVERLRNSAEDRKKLRTIVARQKSKLNKFYANNVKHTHKKSPRNISKLQGALIVINNLKQLSKNSN